jgi:transcription elongation factor GreA
MADNEKGTDNVKKKLEAEIEEIQYELHNELPVALRTAIALGDLSENADYHAAKARQEILRARLETMKRRLSELAMVDLSKVPHDKVGFGSTVTVHDSQKNAKAVYKLVTSEESDSAKGLISATSPIGRGLMGKKVGDIAEIQTPAGIRELEILKLVTMHDQV